MTFVRGRHVADVKVKNGVLHIVAHPSVSVLRLPKHLVNLVHPKRKVGSHRKNDLDSQQVNQGGSSQ